MKKPSERLTPESVGRAVLSWLRTRVDLDPVAALLRRKAVPVHRHSWIYALGDAAVFLFALQVASGSLLLVYYQPTEAAAHQSVGRIMTEVPCGWLVRSVHSWGATIFIAVLWLHFLSVLFARSYRRPRELVWISGVLMFGVVMGSGFSGYLLPWNELSYYATRVGTQIPGKLPWVGPLLVRFLRGGEQLTGETITRFFAAHAMLAPIALVLLLSFHVFLSRVRGVCLPLGMSDKEVRDRRPFASEFLLIDAGVWLLMFGAIVTLAVFRPAAVGVQADLLKPAPEGIRPEWYFLFLYQALKLLPGAAGVLLFALGAVVLVALPFLDRGALGGQKGPVLTAVYAVLLAAVVVLQVVAWLGPAVSHPPEQAGQGGPVMAGRLVSLAFLWLVIGFLLYYLRRLLQQNTRLRRLHLSVAPNRLR